MQINNYIQKNFDEIKRKITAVTRNHENTDDLISDCILSLLEKGPDYHSQLLKDNKVQHYLVKMAYIQYNSSTSPFHLKYRNPRNLQSLDTHSLDVEEKVEESERIDDLSKDIKIYINKLPFYERELATQHFINGKSQRKMSETYGINRIHISRDLKMIQRNIKFTFNRDKYKNE